MGIKVVTILHCAIHGPSRPCFHVCPHVFHGTAPVASMHGATLQESGFAYCPACKERAESTGQPLPLEDTFDICDGCFNRTILPKCGMVVTG